MTSGIDRCFGWWCGIENVPIMEIVGVNALAFMNMNFEHNGIKKWWVD